MKTASLRFPWRSHETGFALITALWLLLIAVMLITAYASLIQSSGGQTYTESNELLAASAAMSGVYYASAYIIMDTNSTQINYANQGIVITEVMHRGKRVVEGVSDTLMISQVYPNVGSNQEYVEIFNPTSNAVSLSGLRVEKATSGASYSLWAKWDQTTAEIPGYSYYVMASATFQPDSITIDSTVSVSNYATSNNAYQIRWGTTGTIMDRVGWGSVAAGGYEGTAMADLGAGQSAKRTINSATGFPQDSDDNSTDFPTVGTDSYPRTSAVSLTPAKLSDRKYEFIEIQNTDSQAIDIKAKQYYLSVGAATPNAASTRYLIVLDGKGDTLGPYEVGLITGIDADTPFFCDYIGIAESQVRWFGLGDASAGPAIDTMLGFGGDTELPDKGDTVVVLGWTGGMTGLKVPDSIPNTLDNASRDTSWKKSSLTLLDDNGAPIDTFNVATWETRAMTPGLAFSPTGGAIDGANDSMWYRLAGDSFIHIADNLYFRVRVYDEAGKINVDTVYANNIPQAYLLDSFLANVVPNPPFEGIGASNKYTSVQRPALINELADYWGNDANKANLVTPTSPYMVYPSGATFREYTLPFLSVYGYRDTWANQININTAESAVLKGAFEYILGPTADGSVIGDKIYSYLTNPTNPDVNDTNPANDVWFSNESDIVKATGLSTAERSALAARLNQICNTFRVNSNGYFTILSNGFVFGAGADIYVDTPLARSMVHAVLKRNTQTGKGEIVYWRELLDDRKVAFPINTRRYPRFKWDPLVTY